jgi:hypothetical protein
MQHRRAATVVLFYGLAALTASYVSVAFPGLHAFPVDLALFFAFPLVLVAIMIYTVQARALRWPQRGLPLAILSAAVLLWLPTIRLGHWTRETLFRWNLPVYEAAVAPIPSGPAPRSVILSLDTLPGYAGLCCHGASVRIERDRSLRASFAVNRNLQMVYSTVPLDTGDLHPHGRRVRFGPHWYEEWR